MVVVKGWRSLTTKGGSDEVKKEERVEAEFIEVCRWLSQPLRYENPYEDWFTWEDSF